MSMAGGTSAPGRLPALGQELADAIRTSCRAPGFTLAASATLALVLSAAALLLLVGLAAAYGPARRAARCEPLVVLRRS